MDHETEAYQELTRRLAEQGYSEAEVARLVEQAKGLDAATKQASAIDSFKKGSGDLDSVLHSLLKCPTSSEPDGESDRDSNNSTTRQALQDPD